MTATNVCLQVATDFMHKQSFIFLMKYHADLFCFWWFGKYIYIIIAVKGKSANLEAQTHYSGIEIYFSGKLGFIFFFCLCRPVFKDASGTLDKGARFSALYRQDSSKLSDEDMFKMLTDFRK